MKRGPRRGYFSRSRSLVDFNKKFSERAVEKTLEKAIESEDIVRVLEIGCGEGRVLMELRKLFSNIEIYGINKKPWAAMRGESSLKRTGTYYNIFGREEIKEVKLPKVSFYDAGNGLRFKDNYFDLVISQVAIQYIKRKDILLEEVWRVMKKNGKAFLHVDGMLEASLPDFMLQNTPRFLIYKNDKVYPLSSFVRDLRKRGYDIFYKSMSEIDDNIVKKRIMLTIKKNNSSPLELGLELDEASSFDLSMLEKEYKGHPILGYRSVYRI